jgi:hypothetical protein
MRYASRKIRGVLLGIPANPRKCIGEKGGRVFGCCLGTRCAYGCVGGLRGQMCFFAGAPVGLLFFFVVVVVVDVWVFVCMLLIVAVVAVVVFRIFLFFCFFFRICPNATRLITDS